MDSKKSIKAISLAVLSTLIQNNQTHGAFGFGVGKSILKHFRGVVAPTSKKKNDIVTPRHNTNSCWLNSGLGAFDNCMGEKTRNEILNLIAQDVEKSMQDNECAMAATERLKNTKLLATVLNDIFGLHSKTITAFSKATKYAFGYNGSQSDPWAVKKLNSDLACYGYELIGWHQGPNATLRELEEYLNKSCSNRITIFVQDTIRPKIGGTQIPILTRAAKMLDHIYCLHLNKLSSGEIKYYLANDKGFGLNYSANIRELKEEEAKEVIKNKSVGFLYLKKIIPNCN